MGPTEGVVWKETGSETQKTHMKKEKEEEKGKRSYLQKQKSKTPNKISKHSTPPTMPPIPSLVSPEKANQNAHYSINTTASAMGNCSSKCRLRFQEITKLLTQSS